MSTRASRRDLTCTQIARLRAIDDKFYQDYSKYTFQNPYSPKYPVSGLQITVLPLCQWLEYLWRFLRNQGMSHHIAGHLWDLAEMLRRAYAVEIRNKDYKKLHFTIRSRGEMKKWIKESLKDCLEDTTFMEKQAYFVEAAIRTQRQRLQQYPAVLAYRMLWHHKSMNQKFLQYRACWISINDPFFLLAPRVESK